jgi:hypothetical protein
MLPIDSIQLSTWTALQNVPKEQSRHKPFWLSPLHISFPAAGRKIKPNINTPSFWGPLSTTNTEDIFRFLPLHLAYQAASVFVLSWRGHRAHRSGHTFPNQTTAFTPYIQLRRQVDPTAYSQACHWPVRLFPRGVKLPSRQAPHSHPASIPPFVFIVLV